MLIEKLEKMSLRQLILGIDAARFSLGLVHCALDSDRAEELFQVFFGAAVPRSDVVNVLY